MKSCEVSVVITTHNRPEMVQQALESALAQSMTDLEVIVVDDGSDTAPRFERDPRLRSIRLDRPLGVCAARNAGTREAAGEWITYLDDDDVLYPEFLQNSMSRLREIRDNRHVGVLSGLRVNHIASGRRYDLLPPRHCPLGGHFSLEPIEEGRSYFTKQSLVVRKDKVLEIGGWDESFRSRTSSEFFFRLNPSCELWGIDSIGYELRQHPGERITGNSKLRVESFSKMLHKHHDMFAANSKGAAEFCLQQAAKCKNENIRGEYWKSVWRAFKYSPSITCRFLASGG